MEANDFSSEEKAKNKKKKAKEKTEQLIVRSGGPPIFEPTLAGGDASGGIE